MRTLVVAVAAVLLLSACTKKEPPAVSSTTSSETTTTVAVTTTSQPAPTSTPAPPPPAAAPATPAGIATADGEKSGMKVVVQELKRTSGGTLSLKFTLVNGTDKSAGFGYEYVDPDHHIGDFATVGGVQLVDEANKKKYFVVRDSDKKCVCSRGLHDVKEGESINLWARFPAPPDDVQKISVIIPHFSPMDDVPIGK